jgi:hypothetical protein
MRWIALLLLLLQAHSTRREVHEGRVRTESTYARETPRIEVEVEAGHPSRFGPGENSNVT